MPAVWDNNFAPIDNADFGHDKGRAAVEDPRRRLAGGADARGRTDADIWSSVLVMQPDDPVLGGFLIEPADACAGVLTFVESNMRRAPDGKLRWRHQLLRVHLDEIAHRRVLVAA